VCILGSSSPSAVESVFKSSATLMSVASTSYNSSSRHASPRGIVPSGWSSIGTGEPPRRQVGYFCHAYSIFPEHVDRQTDLSALLRLLSAPFSQLDSGSVTE
jgi:hypothetical protein